MYGHVVCYALVCCRANRVGNQLGAWPYIDLKVIFYLAKNHPHTAKPAEIDWVIVYFICTFCS